MDIPSSCDPNCVVELIEYNGIKYVTLRVIKDIIKGEPLYLDCGTLFCLDPHKNKQYCNLYLNKRINNYLNNLNDAK